MAYAVTDLAEYFTGRWDLHRVIDNEDGQRIGTFDGSARFGSEPDALMYHEQGELRLNQHHGPAHRTLRYRIVGPGQAEVYFDYGDFFHALDLRSGFARMSHPCRDDVYVGEYLVSGPDQWRQWWRVRGPTKNHMLTTVFDRVR